jgi:divalent metal cation (Fe/Co/Zn/Cd) transporter
MQTARRMCADRMEAAFQNQVRIRWIGHTLRAEVDATVAAGLTVTEAHDIAHHAERHLLAQVRRLTAATVHTSPAGAHPVTGAPTIVHRSVGDVASRLSWRPNCAGDPK